MPNLLRKPLLWVPPVAASIVNGPVATCVFKLQMNGAPINSGMGTSGLCGPIGCIVGWFAPSERALTVGDSMGVDIAAAYANPAVQWIGLLMICVVIPAAVSLLVSELMRKKGWISEGDYRLDI